jgi:siderophore ferric iron reductase
MERLLDRLFLESKGYLSPLEGKELDKKSEASDNLLSIASSEPFLRNLHLALQEAHPEAGAPYWRIRSWGLSCWQPIYLALICVYRLGKTPTNLSSLHQYQHASYIAGYALPDGDWYEAEHHQLVAFTAQQLRLLFNAFEANHVALFGGRPALYKALLADQIMMTVVSADPNASLDEMRHEYSLWAQHLNLPLTPLNRLQQEPKSISFIRRTCCLHYRLDNGELCANCPRHHKEKTIQRIPCLN